MSSSAHKLPFRLLRYNSNKLNAIILYYINFVKKNIRF